MRTCEKATFLWPFVRYPEVDFRALGQVGKVQVSLDTCAFK